MATKLGHPIIARSLSLNASADATGKFTGLNANVAPAIVTEVGLVTEGVGNVWMGEGQLPAYPTAKIAGAKSWNDLVSVIANALLDSEQALTSLGADKPTA